MDASKYMTLALAALLAPGCIPSDLSPVREDAPVGTLDDDDLDDSVTLAGIADLELTLVDLPGEPVDDDDDDDPATDDDDDEPADDDDDEPAADDDDAVDPEEDDPEEEEPDGIPEEDEEDPDDPEEEEEPAEEDLPAPDAVCTDDNHEENDDAASAGSLLQGYYGALAACDDDWYAYDLLAGDQFSIELSGAVGEGDLDLYLYDGAGNLVQSSTGGPDESFEHVAATNGTYLVLVEFVADAGPELGVPYTMSVGWVENDCANDGFEPNDTDLAPWPVPAGVMTLNVCPSGDDFFAVWLETGETLTAEIAFDSAEADLDLTLYSTGGVWVATSSTGTDVETVSVTATLPGYHNVWIELVADFGSELGSPYELELDAP